MKQRYWLLLTILPISLALVILIPLIKADTPPAHQVKPEAMAELIEALKIWRLVDAVSPTSEQEAPLLTQFNKLEKLKTRYRQEHREAMNRLKQVQSNSISADQKTFQIEAALEHYHQTEEDFITHRKQIMDELNQILTIEQQAQFAVFSYTYRQDLKKTLQTLLALHELDNKGKVKGLIDR